MLNLSNEELLRKYQLGDLEAFRAFYERNHKLIFYFLLTRVNSQNIAEDILQDTFLKMHKSITRYDSQQKAMPWLFTIARNTLIDHLRKRKDICHEDMDSFVQTQHLDSTIEEIEPILRSLSAAERTLIEERFLADKSYEQIAAKIKSSPVAVRKRVSRVIAKIRVKFGTSR